MYLGVVFNESGSFTTSKHEIHNKAIKLYLNYEKPSGTMLPKLQHLLHIFYHTIRPILLYGSEILRYFSPSKYINNLDRFIKKETDSLVL